MNIFLTVVALEVGISKLVFLHVTRHRSSDDIGAFPIPDSMGFEALHVKYSTAQVLNSMSKWASGCGNDEAFASRVG